MPKRKPVAHRFIPPSTRSLSKADIQKEIYILQAELKRLITTHGESVPLDALTKLRSRLKELSVD